MNKKNKLGMKIASMAMIGAVGLAAGAGLVSVFDNHPSQADLNAAVLQAQSDSFKLGADSVIIPEAPAPVIVEKEVINTVEVINNDLVQATCDRLLYDDIATCEEEVSAEQSALDKAFEILSDSDFSYALEDENIIRDHKHYDVIKVYNDFEDVDVIRSNFDDSRYKFSFDVKVEDLRTDDKSKVEVVVLVEDNVAELKSVSEI